MCVRVCVCVCVCAFLSVCLSVCLSVVAGLNTFVSECVRTLPHTHARAHTHHIFIYNITYIHTYNVQMCILYTWLSISYKADSVLGRRILRRGFESRTTLKFLSYFISEHCLRRSLGPFNPKTFTNVRLCVCVLAGCMTS